MFPSLERCTLAGGPGNLVSGDGARPPRGRRDLPLSHLPLVQPEAESGAGGAGRRKHVKATRRAPKRKQKPERRRPGPRGPGDAAFSEVLQRRRARSRGALLGMRRTPAVQSIQQVAACARSPARVRGLACCPSPRGDLDPDRCRPVPCFPVKAFPSADPEVTTAVVKSS